MRSQVRAALVAAFLAVGSSCTGEAGSPSANPGGSPDTLAPTVQDRFEQVVCDLPEPHRLRIWRGYHPERSGEIQMVPRQPHFLGLWLSHSGPWEYVQRVPMLLYGPGHVPPAGSVARTVTMADLAPTLAAHLRYDFDAPDGAAMSEAGPVGERPPKLIVTVVWDSVGINVLEEHPDAWPTLRALIPEGAWFEGAYVGSSPSVTHSIHTTLGTGAFPRTHGLSDLVIQVDGKVRGPFAAGAGGLLVPTLADLYDRDRGNEPRVGMIGPPGTLGMMSQGSSFEGGDRDLAIDTNRGTIEPMRFPEYRFPEAAAGVPGLEDAVRRLDLEDGVLDGRWLGEEMLEDPRDVLLTPAFNEHQTRVLGEVIRTEGFGADEPTDLLFVNYRSADGVGHRFSMNSPQMEAVLGSLDAMLAETIETLDREVGEGEWVLALTADHGSTPSPEVSGAHPIHPGAFQASINEAFGDEGGPAVRHFRVTHLWMDLERLEAGGHTLADVADHIAAYTKGQNASDPEGVPPGERRERLFRAAFPSAALETAPCLPRG